MILIKQSGHFLIRDLFVDFFCGGGGGNHFTIILNQFHRSFSYQFKLLFNELTCTNHWLGSPEKNYMYHISVSG